MHLATRCNNKILRTLPPHISSSEKILPCLTRRTLAQLTFLKSHLHKLDAKIHPSPLCPLCNTHSHTRHTSYLQLHPYTHYIVTPGFVNRPRRSGLEELTRLTNMVYNHGYFPGELNKSIIFITLPKIRGITKCKKHRTISLTSHIPKLILRVVMNRVRGRTLQEIAPEIYGVMPDKGTSNATVVLRRISEIAIEKERTYMQVSLTTAKYLTQ